MGPIERILHGLEADERGNDVSALIGPTAVGKTSLSVRLAEILHAEILSVDSRQIYRETTIGTAKPSAEELERVRHHFIDERSIAEPVTAWEYATEARHRIESILAQGKRVLIVGGSTLYIHALIFGLDEVPRPDPHIRADLELRLQSEGLDALAEELRRIDPSGAGAIDLNNPRRVVRALEVFHGSGKPLSTFQQSTEHRRTRPAPPTFVLHRPREILYTRINERVETMFRAGLIDEVRSILDAGFPPTLQALQTIGYRETVQYLRGEIERAEMVDLVKRNTRRYAKRQLTWFRRYPDLVQIELGN